MILQSVTGAGFAEKAPSTTTQTNMLEKRGDGSIVFQTGRHNVVVHVSPGAEALNAIAVGRYPGTTLTFTVHGDPPEAHLEAVGVQLGARERTERALNTR